MNANKKALLMQASFWAAFDGFTSVFLAAYAIALGASNTEVGIIAAIPFIAYLLTQFAGVNISQHHSRRGAYVFISLLSRLCWIGIILAPMASQKPVLIVLIFYLMSRIAIGLSSPSFNTLMADIIEGKTRGNFLGKRFRMLNIFGTITIFLGGLWLKLFPEDSITGFTIMFGAGILLGITSSLSVARIDEPEYKDHEHHTIRQFFSLEGEFKKFVRYSLFFSFAFMLASPLVTVWVLKNLDAGYHWYAIMIGTTAIAKILAAKKIGELTDKYGDKPLTILGMIGTGSGILLLIFVTPQTLWLLILVGILGGLSWAAVDIAKFSYLLGLTTPDKEGMQLAEYNFFNSIPLAIAPWLGGVLSENIAYGIPIIFVTSMILRAISGLLFLRIKEPRAEKEYSPFFVIRQAFHIHHEKPVIEVMEKTNKNK